MYALSRGVASADTSYAFQAIVKSGSVSVRILEKLQGQARPPESGDHAAYPQSARIQTETLPQIPITISTNSVADQSTPGHTTLHVGVIHCDLNRST